MSIRQVFDKRIGEIITDLFGEDQLQKAFEQKGGVPAEFAGMASGDIALRMGLIDQYTKTAILVTQAAERALQMADKIEDFQNSTEDKKRAFEADMKAAAKHAPDGKVPYKEQADLCRKYTDAAQVGFASYDDAVFKFVGSERDPEMLRAAQATWQLSHAFLENEAWALSSDLRGERNVDRPFSFGGDYVHGFRLQAASYYDRAAKMFESAGHDSIAARLKEAGATEIARVDRDKAKGRGPGDFAKSLQWALLRGAQDLDIVLGPGYASDPAEQPYYKALAKLEKLVGEDRDFDDYSVSTKRDIKPVGRIHLKNKGGAPA